MTEIEIFSLIRSFPGLSSGPGPAARVSDDAVRSQARQAQELAARLEASAAAALLRDRTGAGKTVVCVAAAVTLARRGVCQRILVIAPNEHVVGRWSETQELLWAQARAEDKRVDWHFKTHGGLARKGAKSDAFDLVIIDEAHRGLQTPGAWHDGLGMAAKGARLLLVSATPFQLSTEGLIRMLTLGERPLEGAAKLRSYGRTVNQLLHAWRRAGECVDDPSVRGLKDQLAEGWSDAREVLERVGPAPMGDVEAPRAPGRLAAPATAGWLKAYHVARLVPEFLPNLKSGDMFQRRLISSSEAFWAGRSGAELLSEAKRNPRFARFAEALKSALGLSKDHPKVAATASWTLARAAERRHVLIFCVFKETQTAISEVLQASGGPLEVHAPDHAGQLKPYLARFRAVPERDRVPLVIVARDNLSESIDLDGGEAALLHHDLPWNPARITQRWGRLVRRSSGFRPVPDDQHVYPLLPLEFDQRMAEVVMARRQQVDMMVPGELLGSGDEEDDQPPWMALFSQASEGLSPVRAR